MNGQDLKNSILQLAIQGKLVGQREEDGTAKELLKQIKAEKEQLIKEGKIKKQKKLQKINEDEIPFDIPKSWEWVRLIDLALFIKAGGDKPKDFMKEKTETHRVPIIANGIQNDGIIGYTKEATIEESCITVSGRGTIGFSCIRTEPFTPVVRLLVLNISKYVAQKYIQHVLTALLERGVGTSIKQLTVPMLEPKLIPLPPLEEQKRIVAKIEELMPFVEKYDKAYTEVEELNKKFPEEMQKSILQYATQGKLVEQREEEGIAEKLYQQIQEEKEKLIQEGKIKKQKSLAAITEDEIPFEIPETWKWVRLEDICEYIQRGKSPKYSEVEKYPVVSQKCIQWSGFSLSQAKFIDSKTLTSYKEERFLVDGDLMWNSTGLGTLGRIAIYEERKNPYELAVADSHVTVIRPIKTHLSYKYLYYYFANPSVQNVIEEQSDGSTKQKELSTNTVKNYIVPLPPLEEQKRIVAKIEELLPYTKQLVKE